MSQLSWPGASARPLSFPPFTPILRPHQARDPAAPRTAGRDSTVLGIVAILASTACFPLSDLASHSLIPALSPFQVSWLRYIVFVMMALPAVLHDRHALKTRRPGLQLLRGAASALSTISAIVAFKFMPVPEATAIAFASPTVVTILAVLVLGETVGLRRWSAGIVALLGVLIIVRPGSASFCPAALIPLGGAVASAVAVIATRLNYRDSSGTTMIYTALVGFAVLSIMMPFDWHSMSLDQIERAGIVGLFGTLGTMLSVVAYRVAPASLLQPFTYVQLVWASLFSLIFVGTVPGVFTLIGGGVIAASAVYTAMRDRVRGDAEAVAAARLGRAMVDPAG